MERVSRIQHLTNITTASTCNIDEYELDKMQRYNATVGHLNELDGIDCPLCLNRGDIAEFQKVNGMWRESFSICKCKKVRQAKQRIADSGLSKQLASCTFDAYKAETDFQTRMKNGAMHFVSAPYSDFWLFMGGAVGSGKTHLCTAVCSALLKAGIAVKYMDWDSESKTILGSLPDYAAFEEAVKPYKTCDCLYIDDLFKTGQNAVPGDAMIRLAFEIINYRYSRQLKTIISCEHLLDELIAIDAGLGSRIAQRAGKYVFSVARNDGRNYRIKKTAKTSREG